MERRGVLVAGAVLLMAAVMWFLISSQQGTRALDAPPAGDEAPQPNRPTPGPGEAATAPGPNAKPATTLGSELGSRFQVLVTAAGAPVADAEVTAARMQPDSSPWSPRWDASITKKTDATGRATLPSEPGQWLLTVEKAGLAASVLDVPKPVNEVVTTVEVQLADGFELRGKAVDEKGQALAPALIRLVPLGERLSRRLNAPLGTRELTVEPDGTFRAPHLSPGAWRLEGEAEGAGHAEPQLVSVPASERVVLRFRRSGFLEGKVQLADGGVAPNALVTVIGEGRLDTLEAGATGTFSLERMPGSYRVSAKLDALTGAAQTVQTVRPGGTTSVRVVLSGAGGTLEGHVKRDDGAPVEGARVILSPHNEDGLVAEAKTGADGAFRFEHLPRASYDVEAEAKGLEHVSESGFFVGEGATERVELVLARPGRIEGEVKDEAGRPVSLRVRLSSRSRAFAPRYATSDASGRFVFEEVPVGQVGLRGEKTDDAWSAGVQVSVKSGETTRATLTWAEPVTLELELDRTRCPPGTAVTVTAMEAGAVERSRRRQVPAEQTQLRFTLAPAGWSVMAFDEAGTCLLVPMRQFTLKSGQAPQREVLVLNEKRDPELEVTVLEADGSLAANAMVTAREGDQTIGMASTDANGTTGVLLKPKQVVTVSASKQGRGAQQRNVSLANKALKLVLQPAARVLLHIENGTGMSRVMAISETEEMVDEVRATGRDVWLDEVVPGTVILSVTSADGTRAGRMKVQTASGKLTEATLRLEAPALVKGRVPPEATGAWVTLQSPLGTEDVQVDSDGTFVFPPLAPGTYEARAACAICGAWKAKTVVASPGATVELTFP